MPKNIMKKPLDLDPENKAALEYQGELYVVIDKPQLANENLIKLESLCPKSCDELEKLEVTRFLFPAKSEKMMNYLLNIIILLSTF